jgi:hypothetical protein
LVVAFAAVLLVRFYGLRTEEAFLRERVEQIRNLADKADPHIKRRLLDLAARYEKKDRVKLLSESTKAPLAKT